MTSAAAKVNCAKLDPKPDPLHGIPCKRSSHGLSVVNEGKRLVLYGGEHVARTPIYDHQALWIADGDDSGDWQWRCIETEGEGNQPPARVAHAQAAIGELVYIFGGRAGTAMQEEAMDDLWCFDSEKLTWSKIETTGSGPEKRSFHKMVAVDDSLCVFGGCGEAGRLADLHRLDLGTKEWQNFGASPLLRGRGGANLIPLPGGKRLAVVAGFAGEETNDGHVFDLSKGEWESAGLNDELDGLRPRSVCVSASIPSADLCVIFGGEVDPSERGHEGAGGFANDIVLLKGDTAKYLGSISTDPSEKVEERGWSDGTVDDQGNGTGYLYVFGGLTGDDENPRRLNDLLRIEIKSS